MNWGKKTDPEEANKIKAADLHRIQTNAVSGYTQLSPLQPQLLGFAALRPVDAYLVRNPNALKTGGALFTGSVRVSASDQHAWAGPTGQTANVIDSEPPRGSFTLACRQTGS